MRILLLGLLALFSADAGAQTIYKCKANTGAVSYQTDPCASNAKVAAVKNYAPVYDSPQAAARLRSIEAEMAQRRRDAHASRTHRVVYDSAASSRDSQRAHCEAAKAQREDTLRRVGLNRTYDLLRQLDEMVYEACKRT